MTIWEDFEIQCTKYLNENFNDYARFTHQGGADSTTPDILVETNVGDSFYIDAKLSPAQCGQFVLLPNLKTRTFEYSSLNVNPLNKYSEIIMNYMNKDFDAFREAGTAGKDIEMPQGSELFTDWIIKTYKDKGTKFFITNNYTILPIEQFKEHFNVTAKYRIKRSGSSNIGKKHLKSVMTHISTHDYAMTDSHFIEDKLFIVSPQQLHNQRFILCGTEYMFSQRGDKYELRKLSNTYNANVIFSIKHKASTPGMSKIEFINSLK